MYEHKNISNLRRFGREKVNVRVQFPSFGRLVTFFQLTGIIIRQKGRLLRLNRINTMLTKLSRNCVEFKYFEYCPLIATSNY